MVGPMLFISLILGATVLFLLVGLARLRRQIHQATEAVRERQPWLREKVMMGSRWMGFLDLQEVINELLRELKERGHAERGYLEQIQATLGNIREAVFIIDGDNQVVLANAALEELLRVNGDPLGRRLESMVQGADFFEYVRAVKAGEQSEFFVLQVQVERLSCWFEIAGSRLPDRGDDMRKLSLFVLHDITRQTQLERVRTEFVQNLSHELRTPVTVIKGFADTLIEDHDELSSDERGRFLEKIQKNSMRLNHMLEELLTLSRLENDPAVLQFGMTSLNTIVQETVEMFRLRMSEGQQIRVDLAVGNDTLMLDSLRIAQVLENLVENAVRHARGFTELELKTEISNSGVKCRVRDNGQGVPAKDLPHLFERFYRVDKGRSRESGGTGLGLSIAKHIVQQHGGHISATSTVGQGTEMVFEIPYPEVLAEKAVNSLGPNESAATKAIKLARGLNQ